MAVSGIDHVNIDTAQPTETIEFYAQVLDLENRPQDRPGGIGDGAWLFKGDQAMVHLNFHDPASETGRRLAERARSGAFNHVAFVGSDFDGTCRLLDDLSLEYRTSDLPEIGLKQIFVRDPNNVAIEINIRD
jgi:catechol 2,3-dioxygenase-like lactoylglutathione lyase family enzyme